MTNNTKPEAISTEQLNEIVKKWLKDNFTEENTTDIFGREVICFPKFVRVSHLKKKDTIDYKFNGYKVRIRQHGMMPQTRDYAVIYQIIESKQAQNQTT